MVGIWTEAPFCKGDPLYLDPTAWITWGSWVCGGPCLAVVRKEQTSGTGDTSSYILLRHWTSLARSPLGWWRCGWRTALWHGSRTCHHEFFASPSLFFMDRGISSIGRRGYWNKTYYKGGRPGAHTWWQCFRLLGFSFVLGKYFVFQVGDDGVSHPWDRCPSASPICQSGGCSTLECARGLLSGTPHLRPGWPTSQRGWCSLWRFVWNHNGQTWTLCEDDS